MSAWQATATELAGEVYVAFLEEAVALGVLNDREGPPIQPAHPRPPVESPNEALRRSWRAAGLGPRREGEGRPRELAACLPLRPWIGSATAEV